MSNLTKVLSGVLIGILVVALALLAYNAYNKNSGPTWIDDIFQGNVTVDPIPVDTGFKVYTTNNGLVVTNPSNGLVNEENGTIDYTNALYVDMTSDNGYYSETNAQGKKLFFGFVVGKNCSGNFTYQHIENDIVYIYNQCFSNANTALGYNYNSDLKIQIYDSIEASDYLRNLTIEKEGITYNLETKYPIYNINAFIYNLCAYAVNDFNNGYSTYVVTVDVTDYFNVTNANNSEVVTKPILFSYTVIYSDENPVIQFDGFVNKVFEMTTNK